MANKEHHDILRQGVKVWNQWRKDNPEIKPDLTQADLSEMSLEEVYLGFSDLTNANLKHANLSKANLLSATMSHCDLQEANLTKAILSFANLSNSDLTTADLSGAYLIGTNLTMAKLQRTLLDRTTILDHAVLGDKLGGFASLADISWADVNLAVINWTLMKSLGDEIRAHKIKDSDEKVKKSQTRLQEYREAVRANRQLAVVLRNQGLNEEADYYSYRAQHLQRVVLRRQAFLSKEVEIFGGRIIIIEMNIWKRVQILGRYVFSLFLDAIAGYGYKPSRTLFWYLIVVFGFAFANLSLGHVPFFPDALVFSITSFHGRGFFPGIGNSTSLHNPLVVLAAVEAVMGLFIEISFIAAFTLRFFGR